MTVFKSSKKLKAEARASLLGKLGVPVLSVSLYFLLTSVLAELIAFSGTDSRLLALLLSVGVFFVVNVFSKMLRIGLSCIFLKLHLGERVVISDLLSAFRGSSDTAVKLSICIVLRCKFKTDDLRIIFADRKRRRIHIRMNRNFSYLYGV